MSEIPAAYGTQPLQNAKTPWQRFLSAAECETQLELAAFLNIRQSSISDAKKRNAIPAQWLLKLLRQKSINPDWVLSGQGPRFLLPDYYKP